MWQKSGKEVSKSITMLQSREIMLALHHRAAARVTHDLKSLVYNHPFSKFARADLKEQVSTLPGILKLAALAFILPALFTLLGSLGATFTLSVLLIGYFAVLFGWYVPNAMKEPKRKKSKLDGFFYVTPEPRRMDPLASFCFPLYRPPRIPAR